MLLTCGNADLLGGLGDGGDVAGAVACCEDGDEVSGFFIGTAAWHDGGYGRDLPFEPLGGQLAEVGQGARPASVQRPRGSSRRHRSPAAAVGVAGGQ